MHHIMTTFDVTGCSLFQKQNEEGKKRKKVGSCTPGYTCFYGTYSVCINVLIYEF